MEPVILHVDLDAFFASVEERDRPSLKGKPVIVGGRSSRGVVTTANYEARKYGVHSAMPIFIAKKKCPHGIYVPGRMDRYQEVSREILEVLREISPLVEKVSIDEAYLQLINEDGTNPSGDEIMSFVQTLKHKVFEKTSLTLSVGVSYNKFLAKLASDWNKPDGFMVITPKNIPELLFPLPIKKVYGLGPKSCERLHRFGIETIEDLLQLSEEVMVNLLGKSGSEVYQRIRGIDPRPIELHRERKSLGVERTFSENIHELGRLEKLLWEYSIQLSEELKEKGLYFRTLTIKVKYEDFTLRTRSKTLSNTMQSVDEFYPLAKEILREIPIKKSIRLLGISASSLSFSEEEQLDFFPDL